MIYLFPYFRIVLFIILSIISYSSMQILIFLFWGFLILLSDFTNKIDKGSPP